MIRIAITGPECSGKSTLARHLLALFSSSVLVDEQARAYLSEKGAAYVYTKEDVNAIADLQWQAFKEATATGKEVLLADTEFIVLDIWWKEVFREENKRIANYFNAFRFDLFLLCKPDIPWSFDPLRENPNDRDRLFERYEEALQQSGVRWDVLCGPLPERLAKAFTLIDSLRDHV